MTDLLGLSDLFPDRFGGQGSEKRSAQEPPGFSTWRFQCNFDAFCYRSIQ